MANRNLPSPTAPTGLLLHLVAAMPETKRTRVKETLQSGLVHVNDVSVTRHDHPVGPNDRIQIRTERAVTDRGLAFPILFEDGSIIAIQKPCGLLTIATDAEKHKTVYAIMNAALAKTRERAFIVHRLDRFTSGVLLLAKSEDMKNRIMNNWKAAEKIYYALVEGVPSPYEATLTHYLREDERLVVHALNRPVRDSQEATLSYQVMREGRAHSLLRIELDTGRKNQIRAQLAAIGHPIAGDAKYGATTDPIRRLALHAASLTIPHPLTGVRMTFEAPLPGGMEK
jgi:23S rRNA pseudouridine1911/1915/1917 synthase